MGRTLALSGVILEPFSIPVSRSRRRRTHNSPCHHSTRLLPPLNCRYRNGDDAQLNNGSSDNDKGKEKKRALEEEKWVSSPSASPYQILGVDPTASCSPDHLKAAFRARVKEFHPDVCNIKGADALIRRVIQAYEILSKDSKYRHTEDTETESADVDPFEEPECEACDLFVNESLCVGKGCAYSCVRRAPHAFSFTSENGTARAISQGHIGDYLVQTAVGQCPRRCIHYVTPSQRAILEDLLYNVLNDPYNIGDAAFLESLILKATFENNRYEEPKRKPKVSTEYVDWC